MALNNWWQSFMDQHPWYGVLLFTAGMGALTATILFLAKSRRNRHRSSAEASRHRKA